MQTRYQTTLESVTPTEIKDIQGVIALVEPGVLRQLPTHIDDDADVKKLVEEVTKYHQ